MVDLFVVDDTLVAMLLWGVKRRRQGSGGQQQGERYQQKMQIRLEARVEPQNDDAALELPKVEGGGTGVTIKPEEEAGDVAGEAGIELSSSAGTSDLSLPT